MLLTREEVATLTRVKPRTVDAWVQKGFLKPLKAGPRLNRFLRADVEKFLQLRPGMLRNAGHGGAEVVQPKQE